MNRVNVYQAVLTLWVVCRELARLEGLLGLLVLLLLIHFVSPFPTFSARK